MRLQFSLTLPLRAHQNRELLLTTPPKNIEVKTTFRLGQFAQRLFSDLWGLRHCCSPTFAANIWCESGGALDFRRVLNTRRGHRKLLLTLLKILNLYCFVIEKSSRSVLLLKQSKLNENVSLILQTIVLCKILYLNLAFLSIIGN